MRSDLKSLTLSAQRENGSSLWYHFVILILKLELLPWLPSETLSTLCFPQPLPHLYG